MTNKLPEIGRSYRNKQTNFDMVFKGYNFPIEEGFYRLERIIVTNLISVETVAFSNFWDLYEELPAETKEEPKLQEKEEVQATSAKNAQVEVERAKEEVKIWLKGANTDLIDKNSDIF